MARATQRTPPFDRSTRYLGGVPPSTPPSKPEPLQIPVDGVSVDEVSALFERARGIAGESCAVVLAHGAGAPMDAEFMQIMAQGLAEAGHHVLRFSYAYSERMRREGRRFPPDRMPALMACHRAAIQWMREQLPDRPLVLAGKSMGGRVASLLAAEGEACDGLIYLGYPLHPQGKPEKLRKDHFPEISQPSLFLQGTRDGLCDLELLDEALKSYSGPWTLSKVEGGDHSFHVLKRLGIPQEAVHQRLVDEMAQWMAAR